ncbi:hypothetical protein ACEPAF_5709 [Sanghuangporus sanghuang]
MRESLSMSAYLFDLSNGFSGPRLICVIYTCSGVALFSSRPKGFYNKSNFNDESIAEVREKGHETGQYDKYYASKAMAEKTAWSFVSDHKSDITWDLSVVCPIYVFGPVLQEANSPADLNSSSAMFYDALVAKNKKATLEDLARINCDWVDVRT